MLICNVPRFHLPGRHVITHRVTRIRQLNIRVRASIVINHAIAISSLLNRRKCSTMFVNSNTKLPHFVNVPNRGLGNIISTGRFLAHTGLVHTCSSACSAPVCINGHIIIINNNGITVSTIHATGQLNTRTAVICHHDRGRLPTHIRRIRRTGRRNVYFHVLAGPTRILNSRHN